MALHGALQGTTVTLKVGLLTHGKQSKYTLVPAILAIIMDHIIYQMVGHRQPGPAKVVISYLN